MFLLKKILTGLLLPPASLLLLILCGLLLARSAGPRRRRIGFCLAWLGGLSLLVLSLAGVGNALVFSLQTHPPLGAQGLQRAQAIVVLGAGVYRNAPEYGGDTVSRYALERVRYAARLARQSGLPLLLTGGSVFGGDPEAALMRDCLEKEFGVPVRWVETRSRDTGENAALSAALLQAEGIQRIALVSHAWHMRRALPLFENQGLEVIAAPTIFHHRTDWSAFESWLPTAGEMTRIAAHEWLGHWVNEMSR